MADLRDPTWMQCGSSLIWRAEAANRICPPAAVRSLRAFLQLHQKGWPAADLRLAHDRALVVAGLDAAMDTFAPDAAEEWLERVVYPAILDFQEQVADGGGEAALIFWLAEEKRIFPQPADGTYRWHCTGEHRKHAIPIGRCIWNGAESSARRIMFKGEDGTESFVGLYNRRIS